MRGYRHFILQDGADRFDGFLINIIGGESFLYGDLAQVLEYLDRHAKQFRIIKIPTNATMVPNSAVLYDALRKPYVKVCSVE